MKWVKAGSVGIFVATLLFKPTLGLPITALGPTVQTKNGRVVGTVLPSGVRAWLGVPFAAPPVNDLRWKPPQPFSWQGVWPALKFAPECIQNLRQHEINNYFGEEATSEDCLYLNIWTPRTASAAKPLPVVLYIFGGGNTGGSTGMANYDGAKVAARGAIYVSVSFRLGTLGFLAHPELSAEQGGHSGNYSYLDQVAAMKWVKENIARFGGDPAKISIVGQSAGAAAVGQHLVSPLSKGLFSSAVMLSSCRLDGPARTLPQAEQAGLEFQKRLGKKNLEEMRITSADKILAVPGQTGAVIDGYFQPRPLADTIRMKLTSTVPVIAVSTGEDNDALGNPLTKATTVAEFRSQVASMYGSDAPALLALYPVTQDAEVWAVSRQIAQDGGMQGGNRRCAQMMRENGIGKTYLALFDRKHSYRPGVRISDQNPATIGAYHSGDVPFWLGTLDAFNLIRPTRAWTSEDRAISTAMTDALIVFARTGNPSTKSNPWPTWTPENEQRLEIGRDITVKPLRTQGIEWLAAHRPAAAPRRQQQQQQQQPPRAED